MGATYSQFFPPPPTLTEANLPRQEGKVFLITGGAAGVGFELCKILYNSGAKVYLAGRSESKAQLAIEKIKSGSSSSSTVGELHFLYLDLSDLSSIKLAVHLFMNKEERLDVLFNNAGVSNPPKGSIDAQGNELQMGTNCLGHYLLTQLLLPILRTSKARVVWTSSIACEFAPKSSGGLQPSSLSRDKLLSNGTQYNYTLSKTGNWFLAYRLHIHESRNGIISLTQNPGNLKTELTRHFGWLVPWAAGFLMYEARFGAYTNLFAGFGEGVRGGEYVVPWGRRHESPREDLVGCLEDGTAEGFEGWCEEMVGEYR